jgi:serine/threonine protein kinase/tetratricopeptide (TPR) repeat protein
MTTSLFYTQRYQLKEILGTGGMGTVYRAYDRLTAHDVALKNVTIGQTDLMFTSKPSTSDVRLALAREFKTLANLRHPNIISVLDYGFDINRTPFYTMDLLEDMQTFDRACDDKPIAYVAELIIQILQALSYLHRRGVVHRDLKPSNIAVLGGKSVKVLDFGLAKAQEQAGTDDEVAGTLAYMSPEVLLQGAVDIASDIYAVGIIAYEFLTGRHPFNTAQVTELIHNIINKPLDVSTLPHDLGMIILKMTAKDPKERYESADIAMAEWANYLKLPLKLETQAIRESFLQSAQFVGRESELQILSDDLATMLNGTGGRAWLIGGESGIGKSRLLDEFRSWALVKGAQVLRGQGVDGGGAPYQLWREIARWLVLMTHNITDEEESVLKELIPNIEAYVNHSVPDAPQLDPQDAQQRLVVVIQSLFRRQTQPVVLLLEDLQWVSESLLILKSLLRMLDELPVFIVGSYRDDERPNLPQDLPSMRLIRLQRLHQDEIGRLSDAILGAHNTRPEVVDFINRETDGNVFFIIEVIRELAKQSGELAYIGQLTLPQSIFSGGVMQIVHQRLGRVPPMARPLLNLASVLGRALDLDLLAGYDSPMPLEAWLTTCSDIAVLEVHEGTWRFAHDKLREAVLDEFTDDDRRHWYGQAAHVIEKVYPHQEAYLLQLAKFWRVAENVVKETDTIIAAGNLQLRFSAFMEAVLCYQRAQELLPKEDIRRCDILINMGEANALAGNFALAKEYLDEGLNLARQFGDYHRMIQALGEIGRINILRDGDLAKAQTALEEGLIIASELNEPQPLSIIYRQIGNYGIVTGNYDTARENLEKSVAYARTAKDYIRLSLSLNSLSHTYAEQGRFEEALAMSAEVRQIASDLGNRRILMFGITHMGLVALRQKDYAQALKHFLDGLELCYQTGDQEKIVTVENYVGTCYHGMGDTVKAEKHWKQALDKGVRFKILPEITRSLVGLAMLITSPTDQLELLLVVTTHPSCNWEARHIAEPLIAQLQAQVGESESQAIAERAKSLDMLAMAEKLL